jgi:NAD(P)-dependent dehydrogenase (short-subunit alcohol dehydrogenase family)
MALPPTTTGRKIVVTGASTGFGRCIAELAAAAGWQVLGTVRKDSDAEQLRQKGIATARLDLGVPDSIGPGCEQILQWCGGKLDALVNNAGSTWPGPMELVTMADLRMQFEVNTFGHIDITQRLLPAVRAANGHVLFISSDSTTITPPMLGPYAASKRALEAMAEVMAQETAGQGIRVSIVAPGPYQTAIWGTSLPRGQAYLTAADPRLVLYQQLADQIAKAVDARPMGDPMDLAKVVMTQLVDPAPPLRTVAPLQSRVIGRVKATIGARRFHKLLRWVIARQAAM